MMHKEELLLVIFALGIGLNVLVAALSAVDAEYAKATFHLVIAMFMRMEMRT
jgi:hypothetical protein